MIRKIVDKIAPIVITTTIITGLIFLYWGIYSWAGAMVGISAILVVLAVFDDFKILKKANKEFTNQKDRLKSEGTKVTINLNDVEIKSNLWSEEKIVNNSKTGALNQISGRAELNVATQMKHRNLISFYVPHKNQLVHISQEVEMESTTLQMKLALQKETSLYFNKKDPLDYYLDLEFLK